MAVAIPEAFGDRALLFAGALRRDPGRPAHVPRRSAPPAAGRSSASGPGGSSPGSSPRACSGSPAAFADGRRRAPRSGSSRSRSTTRAPLVALLGARPPAARRTTTWEVETSHFAERFQLFMIIALGETIVITGATTAELELDAATRRGLRGSRSSQTPRCGGSTSTTSRAIAERRLELARRPHAAGPRRLHLPARRDRRGRDPRRGRRRARDRPPDRRAAGRGARRRSSAGRRSTSSRTSLFRLRMAGTLSVKRLGGGVACVARRGALGASRRRSWSRRSSSRSSSP